MGSETNIILPAAGKGTRLNLPYPKELHRVIEGSSLIDFSLAHIRARRDKVDRVSIVIDQGKEAVYDYVSAQLPDIEVRHCRFNHAYSEWPGSILSAEELFLDRNIVFLPDSVLTPKLPHEVLAQFDAQFAANREIVFGYKSVTKEDPIHALGALMVRGDRIEDFCDKPDPSIANHFNAFWTTFGFCKEAGPDLLRMMMKSVARERVNITALDCTIGAFEVEGYKDLGTWPSIRDFVGRHGR